jgi:hypothetical protein
MVKIGIVTWHYNPNYGGLLQAYALQEIIKKLGYNPEFVNYRPDMNTLKKRIVRKLKDAYMVFNRPAIHTSRKMKYKFIEEKLNIGKLYYSYDDLSDEADNVYDVGVCGSDQIWSNNTGIVNPFYYLTFLEERKRISYAPSIGYDKIQDNIRDEFRKCVNRIKFLSIREEQGAEIIKSITGRDAIVVLDPSLLLNNAEWLEEIKDKKCISPDEKYILLYILGDSKEHVRYAQQLSKNLGYKLIAIETKYCKIKDLEVVYGDPLDFVELVNNASYILTDSFHGVAFSINLEKQFAVFKRFKDDDLISQNSRIYNILIKTNLKDRLISADESISFVQNNKIDYDKVIPLLEKERKISIDFLSKSLELVINDR